MTAELAMECDTNSAAEEVDNRRNCDCNVVYFFYVHGFADVADRIKIGTASNYQERLNEHTSPRFGIVPKIRELAVVRATRNEETALHSYFREHRVDKSSKEEFHPVPPLCDYIRWLREFAFVWTPEDDDVRIDDCDVVSGDLWLPNDSRRKPRPAGLAYQFRLFGVQPPERLDAEFPPREVMGDDFYTSKKIIDAVRSAMGSIDLDPASHAVANRIVKAKRFFSSKENGLLQEWSGNVWLNPPFSLWKEFTEKLHLERTRGNVDQMCVLAALRTLSAKFFNVVHHYCQAMCILHGRIPLWGPHVKHSPTDGHVVFYFGTNTERFIECFESLGTVYLNSAERHQ